ncbi:GNAT family N-acetyltransferase [Clostridium tagluense]|uniref:GNAT family N-acetyltransferase n=1 Tax=Clostridium tagluense TaxID=360422 RepID=UPI001CF1B218|nr:GNAT family N-acetyltransferase [Clostridium tagluense]MCB2312951.1 GNAT family N-acetyltransferase [Clostridium tagluense]MCB2317717.1 GNAT family N-acetyltransferase [Clostridium tagluense]MCB2322448.1 GNAT family N-acetyltransferase [Clostridium tagluense]MCB2327451.1 GNAT family N-acetyltransferase [Clostridium tagluense]MCB2332170.1 GNAT family N-acetyltransferase [Clostridium tagluense]
MVTMTNASTTTKEFNAQLNELIMHAFDFSFDKWHAKNVWNDDYEIYSIIEDGVMLANISVTKMKMVINGEKRDYLQFGSVATREEHRGKGLSKKLMEHIFSIYPDTPCFLHGGDSVVGFYPKFGFKPITYKQPYIEYKLNNSGEMIKLNITNPKVDKYLKERTQYSKVFDCINQYSINWFHLIYGHQNNIYEIPQLDVMLVAHQRDNKVTIYDIVASRPVSFEQIVPYLCFEGVDIIQFGFNPDWLGIDYNMREYKIDDENPFLKGDFGLEQEYMIPRMITT